MSELKAIRGGDIHDDVEFGYGDEDRASFLYYLKSEADELIDELKQKLNEAQTELELWRDGSIISEAHQKELDVKRHSDYKRCLAMAEWCEATSLWCYQAANTLPAGLFHATLHGKTVMIEPKRLFNRSALLTKWNTRWLELAEKLKPNSTG